MEFRPCIDIHNGKVKQIIGGSLKDDGNLATENFVALQDAAFFADFYRKDKIRGGHIILLNPPESNYYNATKEQALKALKAYPGGLQVGGGVTPENAGAFLEAGASHVIVTSYVFKDGRINYENLEKMKKAVGVKRLVLDVSCRKKADDCYYVVTDRWQKFTEEKVNSQLLNKLMVFADEFLVHAVDVEGKAAGIEKELAALLGAWDKRPVTYAGGVGSFADLEELNRLGQNRVNVTIGSALDLFGGTMAYQAVLEKIRSFADEIHENAWNRK